MGVFGFGKKKVTRRQLGALLAESALSESESLVRACRDHGIGTETVNTQLEAIVLAVLPLDMVAATDTGPAAWSVREAMRAHIRAYLAQRIEVQGDAAKYWEAWEEFLQRRLNDYVEILQQIPGRHGYMELARRGVENLLGGNEGPGQLRMALGLYVANKLQEVAQAIPRYQLID